MKKSDPVVISDIVIQSSNVNRSRQNLVTGFVNRNKTLVKSTNDKRTLEVHVQNQDALKMIKSDSLYYRSPAFAVSVQTDPTLDPTHTIPRSSLLREQQIDAKETVNFDLAVDDPKNRRQTSVKTESLPEGPTQVYIAETSFFLE
jgi:hypothetical protein